MRGHFQYTVAVLLIGVASLNGDSRDLTEQQEAAVAATSYLLAKWEDGGAWGSAFCIDSKRGHFLANAHLARGLRLAMPPEIELVFGNPGTSSRRSPAKVLFTDPRLDLVLLEAKFDEPPGQILPASCDDLKVGQRVTFVGNTLSRSTSYGVNPPSKGTSCSVGKTDIKALFWRNGELSAIELNENLARAEHPRIPLTGGPLLDDDGKILGLLVANINSGRSLSAIPIPVIRRFLAQPRVKVTTPEITASNRATKLPFRVEAAGIQDSSTTYEVLLRLWRPDGWEDIPMTRKGTTYQAAAAPVLSRPQGQEVAVQAFFDNGRIAFRTGEQSLSVKGQQFRLRDIDQIFGGADPKVRLNDGKLISGFPGRLKAVRAYVGGRTIILNLGDANRVVVSVDEEPAQVHYVVKVSKDGYTHYCRGGRIPISGRSDSRSTDGRTQLTGTKKVSLDSWPEAVVRAAGDRLLLLKFGKKVMKFDATTGKLTNFMNVPFDDYLLAAGRSKVLVVDRKNHLLQRFDLATGKKEKSAVSPWTDKVCGIGMGADNDSVAFFVMGTSPRSKAALLDVENLTAGSQPMRTHLGNNRAYGDNYITSTDPGGTIMTICRGNDGRAIFREGNRLTREESVGAYSIPGPKGQYSYGDSVRMRNGGGFRNLRAYVKTVPCMRSGLFLAHARDRLNTTRARGLAVIGGAYLLHLSDPWSPVAGLANISYPEKLSNRNPAAARISGFQLSQRNSQQYAWRFLMAQDSLFVSIRTGTEGDPHMLLTSVDLSKAIMETCTSDRILVDVPIIEKIRDGEMLNVHIGTISKTGVTAMKLLDGPGGMRLTAEGRLTWVAHKPRYREEVQATIEVSDGSGTRSIHQIELSFEESETELVRQR